VQELNEAVKASVTATGDVDLDAESTIADIPMTVSEDSTINLTSVSTQADIPLSVDGTFSVTTNSDYNALLNKPSIESVTLSGDKSFEDLGLSSITNSQILQALS